MDRPQVRRGVVTVGIPTHNRRELLERALRGVLQQSWAEVEIIVADDASTDATAEFMAEFAHNKRIRYLRAAQNLGIARNTNRCLEAASGEFLLILNDDDELESEALQKLSAPLRLGLNGIAADQIGVSWCVCKVQTAQRAVKWLTAAGPALESGLDLVVGLFDGRRGPRFCGVMVRTEDARAVGGYVERHGPIPDVGNWTQVALRRRYAACVPEALARYTAHDMSCTGSSRAQAWQEAGERIFEDLAAYCRQNNDRRGVQRLRRSRKNFICGLLVTILMQSMGRPGWWGRARRELWRVPQYFFTPMLLRRILVDGHKLLRRKTREVGA